MSTPPQATAADPAIAADPPIEADTTDTDPVPAIEADPDERDSVLDERLSAYTASLSSSVVDFPVEHGRRYHAFRPGTYHMPNDEREMDRLDFHHHMVVLANEDKLYTAPIDKDKTHRILDIGTGTGIWAIEVGDQLPGAEILGNDLSPIQPEWVPPNVKFEVDDAESPWTHTAPFDFIFCRYLLGGIADWPALMGNIYENLRPGGWAEFQDYDITVYSDDDPKQPECETYKWAKTLIKLVESMGREPAPGPKLEKWMRDAGFVNVKAKKIKLPIGPWAKDARLKELGTCNLIQTLNGLEAFSLRILCDVGKMSEEEVHVLLSQVRKEMKNPKMHQMYDLYVVYGQKPE